MADAFGEVAGPSGEVADAFGEMAGASGEMADAFGEMAGVFGANFYLKYFRLVFTGAIERFFVRRD